MELVACVVPAAAVRIKASHKSEMVNQLLFGEIMEVLKIKKGEWLKIRSVHDKYEGYIRANLVAPVAASDVDTHENYMIADTVGYIFMNQMEMLVSAGCSLLNFDEGNGSVASMPYSYEGNFIKKSAIRPQPELVTRLTHQWLNAPYLWGGRTPLGVDCSGFVQVIFKLMGVDLWRDAYLQAEQGININELADVQCGDLAFFGDRKNRIKHVGILLNDHEIIHASGNVRIDHIDTEGITHTGTGKRTHTLKGIRRYW